MEEFQGLLIIMVVVWIAGKIFRSLQLPVLYGELLGGIIVGPLVLNVIDPGSETIKILAELGIFFLMLHTGLETDPRKLMKSSKKSILISLTGLTTTFTFLYLTSLFLGFGINESMILAIGLSMTAVAITIRVFKDTKVDKLPIANTILAAAITSDIVGLIAASVILQLVETGQLDLASGLFTLAKVILFFAVVIFTGFKTSKYFAKILRNKGFTFALIVALSLGLIAEHLGLHMIIGAFLAGLFIRQEIVDDKIFNKIEDRIYGLSYSFLGPIFFTSLAFNLDFSAVTTMPAVLITIMIVAFLGQAIGSGAVSLLQKIPLKETLVVSLAMNSRGAIDLVIASIGLEKGIISKDIFSIMVIVIFTTTLVAIFAIKPIVKRLRHA